MTDALAMVVEFRAAHGRESELHRRLLALVEPTRAEDGCLRYDLHVNETDPTHLAFYEVWASKAHHAAHDETAHVKALVADLDALISEPVRVIRLRRLEP